MEEAKDMRPLGTRLVEEIRDICHGLTQEAEASDLIVASLKLCAEYEACEERSLACEKVIHDTTKALERLI